MKKAAVIDFSWTHGEIDRFVRALSFYPLKSTLACPKTTYQSRACYVDRIAPVVSTMPMAQCGTIVEIRPDRIDVQVADGVIGLTSVLDEQRRTLKMADFIASYGLAVGSLFEGAPVRISLAATL